jgi:hypothetical protein
VHYGDNFYNYDGSHHEPSKTPGQDVVAHAMESLGFAQMDTRRDTISRAHINTCKWLFDKQEYLDWRNVKLAPTHCGFFWIKSKPGAGKSTLMKYMVKYSKKQMPQDTIISFFFNARGGVALETSLEGMYRSLLHQLLAAFPALQTSQRASKITKCAEQKWQIQTLETLFHDAVLELGHGESHLTCFIDALDECPEDDVRALLRYLAQLSYSAREEGVDLHVCFSSRHYPNITFKNCQHLVLDGQEGHEQDISTFVETELVGEGDLIEEMKSEIQQRAQGVFLWAELVVHILNKDCDRGNVKTLRSRLDEIPDGLDDLFQDILTRGVQQNQYLIPILQWILYAQRPLTPEELYLAVHSGTFDSTYLKPWSEREIGLQSVHLFILDSSKGLAETTKVTNRQKSTVQFIHESVRDYLRKTASGVLAPELVLKLGAAAHAYLYRCCCLWMSDDVIKHLSLPRDLPKAKSPEAKELRDNTVVRFPFLEYCVSNLIYHAEMAVVTTIIDFLQTFPRSAWTIINDVLAIYDTRRHSESQQKSLIYILTSKNAPGLLSLALRSVDDIYGTSPHRSGNILNTSLWHAIKKTKNLEVAGILLHSQILEVPSSLVRDSLSLAVDKRDLGALRIITQCCTSPEKCENELSKAIGSRNPSLVRELLEWFGRADTFSPIPIRHMFTPVVLQEDMGMLQVLLDHVRLFSDIEPNLGLSLLDACSTGNADIVLMLIVHGANASDELVLWLSKQQFHECGSIARVFVSEDVPNACTSSARRLLFRASMHGFENIVHNLFQKGINLSAVEHFAALSEASQRGHGLVVKTLIANESSFAPRAPSDYSEVVQAAVIGRHGYVLEILLDRSGNFRAQSRETFTEALRQATQLGFNEIVNILHQRGVTLPEDSG